MSPSGNSARAKYARGTAAESATQRRRQRNPFLVALGADIRRRRMAAGMTLEQLAEHAKLTPNYIGTIENGWRDPSLSTVEQLASGLKIQVREFFEPMPQLTEDARLMASIFQEVSPELQGVLLALLRMVARLKKR